MDWHWIGIGLALDWYRIDTGLTSIDDGLALDWHWIGIGLTLDWHQIGMDWHLIVVGLVLD